MQRRGMPIFLVPVVRPAVGRTGRRRETAAAAVIRGTIPTEQVAEHECGQQAGHAHRAARYHFRFGRQNDSHVAVFGRVQRTLRRTHGRMFMSTEVGKTHTATTAQYCYYHYYTVVSVLLFWYRFFFFVF